MSGHDDQTLKFYAAEAKAYAARAQEPISPELQTFMQRLPPGSQILELGCGSGADSETLLAHGFSVTPTDGSPELALEAERRLGQPVAVLRFEKLAVIDTYDGIWANACLLHVPRAELAPVLSRIHAALKPGGVFFASYKAGQAEGRDGFGRYYNYPSPEWLRQAYERNNWRSLAIGTEKGSGYDNLPTDWLNVTAIKET